MGWFWRAAVPGVDVKEHVLGRAEDEEVKWFMSGGGEGSS